MALCLEQLFRMLQNWNDMVQLELEWICNIVGTKMSGNITTCHEMSPCEIERFLIFFLMIWTWWHFLWSLMILFNFECYHSDAINSSKIFQFNIWWYVMTCHDGAFHTGSAQGSAQKYQSRAWAELDLSLQCEQSLAQILSVGLEFLIRAAGCSH